MVNRFTGDCEGHHRAATHQSSPAKPSVGAVRGLGGSRGNAATIYGLRRSVTFTHAHGHATLQPLDDERVLLKRRERILFFNKSQNGVITATRTRVKELTKARLAKVVVAQGLIAVNMQIAG